MVSTKKNSDQMYLVIITIIIFIQPIILVLCETEGSTPNCTNSVTYGGYNNCNNDHTHSNNNNNNNSDTKQYE